MRKLPCWLIGHRGEVFKQPPDGLYLEYCINCPKLRYFTIDSKGRHNKEWHWG